MKRRASLATFSTVGLIAALTGCHTPAARTPSATPCMEVLPLFTAANVPAMGPDETPAPAGRWTNGITPPNLPGKGLAQHPMLIVCENYDKMLLVNDGKIIWTYQTGNREYPWEYDDDLPPEYRFASAPQSCTRLANGNTIFCSRGDNGKGPQMIEVTRDKKVVWVLQDWKDIDGVTAVQVLDDPGIPEIPGQSEH